MKNKDLYDSVDEAKKAWETDGQRVTKDGLHVLIDFDKWMYEDVLTNGEITLSDDRKKVTLDLGYFKSLMKGIGENVVTTHPGFHTEHGTCISAIRANDDRQTVVFKIDRERKFADWEAGEYFRKQCAELVDTVCAFMNAETNGSVSYLSAVNVGLMTQIHDLKERVKSAEEESVRLRKERDEAKSHTFTSPRCPHDNCGNCTVTTGSYTEMEKRLEKAEKERDSIKKMKGCPFLSFDAKGDVDCQQFRVSESRRKEIAVLVEERNAAWKEKGAVLKELDETKKKLENLNTKKLSDCEDMMYAFRRQCEELKKELEEVKSNSAETIQTLQTKLACANETIRRNENTISNLQNDVNRMRGKVETLENLLLQERQSTGNAIKQRDEAILNYETTKRLVLNAENHIETFRKLAVAYAETGKMDCDMIESELKAWRESLNVSVKTDDEINADMFRKERDGALENCRKLEEERDKYKSDLESMTKFRDECERQLLASFSNCAGDAAETNKYKQMYKEAVDLIARLRCHLTNAHKEADIGERSAKLFLDNETYRQKKEGVL